MGMVHLTDSTFEKEVLQSKLPVLVDFWAPWCAPCQMLGAVIEELAQGYKDKLKIGKINIDENKNLPMKYHILSIPTLLFFKEGKVVSQIMGARPASEIKKIINSLIDKDK